MGLVELSGLGVTLVIILVITCGVKWHALSIPDLPFLVRRSDSGKFAYWPILPQDIVPHFMGKIDLPWRR